MRHPEARGSEGRRGDARATLVLPRDIEIIPDKEAGIAADKETGPAAGPLQKTAEHSRDMPRHLARAQGAVRRQLAAGDVLAIGTCWAAQAFTSTDTMVGRQLALGGVATLFTLAAMHRAGLYRARVCALRSLEAVRVAAASIVGVIAFVVFAALSEPVGLAGPAVTGAAVVIGVLILRWRFSRWLKARHSASEFLRTVVMVGVNEDAEDLWTLLSEEPELGYRIGGVAGDYRSDAPWHGLPRCSEVEQLGDLAARADANGVIVVASALGPRTARRRSTWPWPPASMSRCGPVRTAAHRAGPGWCRSRASPCCTSSPGR